jgi:hypothetical protein
MSTSTTTTPTAGNTYNLSSLKFVGWSDGDGTGHDGYAVEYYFDARGCYLGPDEHGIEPMFETLLEAQENDGDFCVIDPDGGVWWPSDDAAAEINASSDPKATAIRIATENPMRGTWHN